ncbi:MAG: hypothetical protein IT204_12365 [Fimbriimonadaceae bacterium]|nr:hypothetical protein [Fimbriimonadaceae bacterium]
MRWIAALLLGTALLPLRAEEGRWDPSGEYVSPPPKDPAKDQAPSTSDEVLKAIKSDKLRPYVAKLASVLAPARAGDYKGALALAQKLGREAGNVMVTAEDLRPRAILAGLYQGAAAELQGLLGQTSAAASGFRTLERLKGAPADFVAAAVMGQGFLELQDGDPAAAVSYERRARGIQKQFPPLLEGIASLYRGSPQQALPLLQQAARSGRYDGLSAIYTAAAYLAAGRPSEAQAAYTEPAALSNGGYLPVYYLVGGLLAAAEGDLAAAKAKFQQASSREYGRVRQGAVLAAVADLALGNTAAGTALLQQRLSSAPRHFQPTLNLLLRQPAANRAKHALQTARYWFTTNSAGASELAAVPAAAPAPTTPPAAGAASAGPAAAPPADSAPLLPPVGPPAAGAGAAAGGEAPAGEATAADLGIDARAPETQAVQAYHQALRHIAEGRVYEAEVALASAVRSHGFPEAYLALGQLRLQRGVVGQAERDFRAAVAGRPNWADAWYGLALAEDQLGRPTAAARYRAALGLGLPERLAGYARQRLVALGGS